MMSSLGEITADQNIASNVSGNIDGAYLWIGAIAAASLLAVGAYVMSSAGARVGRGRHRIVEA